VIYCYTVVCAEWEALKVKSVSQESKTGCQRR
jgi:hypothetical protein